MTTRASLPNILFINCHDLGQHLGCYGVSGVCSPVLDRLAQEGVRFRRSFCSAPQCSPSRASMFTGRYPHSNGVMGLAHAYFHWDFNPGERHLAGILRDVGYATALVGHQHETHRPELRGWSDIAPTDEDSVSEVATTFLSRFSDAGRPFYLQVGFQRPHRHATASGYRSPPDDRRGVTIPPYLVEEASAREDLAGFQGDIATLDRHVGVILEELGRLGRDADTLVIFTTDHGIPYPRAKCSLYDPGLETALILRWPDGIHGGRVVDDMISNVDYVPTLLDILRLPQLQTAQGQSFAALLRGGTGYSPRTEIFAEMTYHQYYDPRRCIRTDTHKLVANFSAAPFFMDPSQQWRPKTVTLVPPDPSLAFHEPLELYDLTRDPLEHLNLAGRPEYAATEADLRRRLLGWMEATSDPLLHGAVTSPMHVIAMNHLRAEAGRS
jgi:N-sulfoglucosamine sulfohydrolase